MTAHPADRNLGRCPVCDKPYLVFVTHKRAVRTVSDVPLYACLSCQSFCNPGPYSEDEAQLERDLEWHKKVAERNLKATDVLLKHLRAAGANPARILDIGAGTGTLLKAAQAHGIAGVGYEVNPLTQPYARDVNGVDVRAEFWTADTDCGDFDLLVSIMVLEHIETPRPMIENMVKACLAQNAQLFISVPFVDRNRWPFLHEKDPRAERNPFFDQDVHVTHYSSKGLEGVLREFGMTEITWIRDRKSVV